MNLRKVSRKLSLEDSNKIIGSFSSEKDYDEVIRENCTVLDENGDELFSLILNAIPNSVGKKAYPSLLKVASGSNNRGMATDKKAVLYKIKEDGTRSKTSRTAYMVPTGIAGYFDRYPRIPYCRQTAFTHDKPEEWKNIVPYIQYVNKQYKKYCPKTYKMQRKEIDKCCGDFVIADTVFTTITVNVNWKTAYHRDKKNLDGGMAGMGVVGVGKYEGGYLIFPEYRIAVDIRSTDVIVMNNTHLIHGNSELIGKGGTFKRVSMVCYFREGIKKCKTLKEELERAKKFGCKISDEL
tara:strand:- start:11143 stop:12024 length:882 start_codon:yes stop_codon:yes gene_type:complete